MQVDNVNNHKQKGSIAILTKDIIHGFDEFRDTLFDGLWASSLSSADGEFGILYSELFDIGCEECFDWPTTQVTGRCRKDRFPKLFDVLACDLCQFCCNFLILRCAGWRTQDKGIGQESSQHHSRSEEHTSE